MPLITVNEASRIIDEATGILPEEEVSLVSAAGRVLRQSVVADRDVPPYDRVMMDGIAFAYSAWEKGLRAFPIAGTQPAGSPPKTLENPESCFEIMTGSVLSAGCDCIAPYEEVEIADGKARLKSGFEPVPGQFIHQMGSDYPAGSTLLQTGRRLTSRQIAVAAASGYASLQVTRNPRVTLVSTGDELVDIGQPLERYQIRPSNVYALLAGLSAQRIPDTQRLHLNDDPVEIEEKLASHLESSDVVILSGGVSKGKFDFIPDILDKLGVEKLFHGVAQRPGKPFWFGRIKGGASVFALPGNPLSTLICFHRFVIPALEKMLALPNSKPVWAALDESFDFEPPVTFYLPVDTESSPEGILKAHPRTVNNSGDYASVVNTTGFVELPNIKKSSTFAKGYCAQYYPWV